jgi:hypothetical protein
MIVDASFYMQARARARALFVRKSFVNLSSRAFLLLSSTTASLTSRLQNATAMPYLNAVAD